MDRTILYKNQVVQASDLNTALDRVESAAQTQNVDLGYRGCQSGLTVTQTTVPSTIVRVSSGVGTDQLGRRVYVGGTQNVNLSAYIPSTSGASRIVAIVARFRRVLSTPRQDGNGVTIFTEQGEGAEIVVLAGAEIVGTPTPPAAPVDGLLLADVLLTEGDTTISDADVDMISRRDWAWDLDVAGVPRVQVGTLGEAVLADRVLLSDHINNLSSPHSASSISYSGTDSIADVGAQLDAILDGSAPYSGPISHPDGGATLLESSTGTPARRSTRYVDFVASSSVDVVRTLTLADGEAAVIDVKILAVRNGVVASRACLRGTYLCGRTGGTASVVAVTEDLQNDSGTLASLTVGAFGGDVLIGNHSAAAAHSFVAVTEILISPA